MSITDVHLIYFSPTHTSRHVGEAIVRGVGLEKVRVSDLTYSSIDFSEIGANTLMRW